jgi:hypothetical protein
MKIIIYSVDDNVVRKEREENLLKRLSEKKAEQAERQSPCLWR